MTETVLWVLKLPFRVLRKMFKSGVQIYHELFLFLKRQTSCFKRNDCIAILFQYQYHADYLASIVQNDSRFVFRRSVYRCRVGETAPFFDWADPRTLRLVLTDMTHFPTEKITRQHKVLMRMQHSPGFGFKIAILYYPQIKKNRGKLMIPRIKWKWMQKSRYLDDETDLIRRRIVRDGVPLLFTDYDPKMNKMMTVPSKNERQGGTLLAAFNFRIRHSEEDISRIIESIGYLHKDFKIKMRYHQIIDTRDFKIGSPLSKLQNYLEHLGIETMTKMSSMEELIDLYDRHEFILTDGSGSAYEAIARGCKALTLDGLSYQRDRGILHPATELELLPRTLVWDYRNHSGWESDMNWMKSIYDERFLAKYDVMPFVAEEILQAFREWE